GPDLVVEHGGDDSAVLPVDAVVGLHAPVEPAAVPDYRQVADVHHGRDCRVLLRIVAGLPGDTAGLQPRDEELVYRDQAQRVRLCELVVAAVVGVGGVDATFHGVVRPVQVL